MPLKSSSAVSSRNSYIPDSARRTIAEHMDRKLPSYLKKYQNQTHGVMPKSVETSITKHMERSLPNHLKKYADPYVQQNMVYSNNRQQSTTTKVENSEGKSSYSNPTRYVGNFMQTSNNQPTQGSPQSSPVVSPMNGDGANGTPPPDDYDFIMNSGASKKPAIKGPSSATGKLILIAVGVILLIILVTFGFSLLNASSNKQKENLLQVAELQTEIIRVIDNGNNNVASTDLLNRTTTLRAVVSTSQKETLQALTNRGSKIKDKDLSKGEDSGNDAKLEQGLSVGKYDQTYEQVLDSLLSDYVSKLNAVYEAGGPKEKAFSSDAYNQVQAAYVKDNPDQKSN